MEALIVLWIACGIVGYMIDNGRGAVLGLLLGILGLIISLLLSYQDKRHKETLEALTNIKVKGDVDPATLSEMRAAVYRA